MEKEINNNIPEIIFIVPYRDRLCQKEFFLRYMKYILEDYPDNSYEIIFSHQCDDRTFNRGAMKNIGFIYAKTKYPEHYNKITFVFNDIDCVPYSKNLIDYKTKLGMIKHFYGFEHALGGIISITGKDFERINGFPNYWGWGFEDNSLKNRIDKNGIYISRKQFFNIGDNRILHLFDTFKKESDKNIGKKFMNDEGNYGINSIFNLKNQVVYSDVILSHNMLNVKSFETEYVYNDLEIVIKDMREKNNLSIKNTKSKKMISYQDTYLINNDNTYQDDYEDNYQEEDIIQENNEDINKKLNNNQIHLNLTNIPSRKCKLLDGKCENKLQENKLQENKLQENKPKENKKLIRYAGHFKFFNK